MAGGHKLVRANGGSWELYDLDADRAETRDLAAQRPALRDRMIAEYRAWFEKSGLSWRDGGPQPGYLPLPEADE